MFVRRTVTSWSKDNGVSLLEAAIFLPLVLGCIFLVIAIAVGLNARSALSTGMTDALRLAHTRADPTRVGASILPMIQQIRSGVISNDAKKLLVSLPAGEEGAGIEFLNSCFGAVYNRELRDLPAQHLYTLVYLNQALSQSIGPSLRFPCLPPGATNPPGCSGSEPRQGCVGCYLFDPVSDNPNSSMTSPNPRSIAIRCDYSPSNVFLAPLFGVLRLIGVGELSAGLLTIHRERLFEASGVGL